MCNKTRVKHLFLPLNDSSRDRQIREACGSSEVWAQGTYLNNEGTEVCLIWYSPSFWSFLDRWSQWSSFFATLPCFAMYFMD